VKAGALGLTILLAMSVCSAQGEGQTSPEQSFVNSAVPAPPEGPVLDEADIIPAEEEAALDARLRRLVDETGDALIVVTVDSLEGQPIEDFSFDLFNSWGIGAADTDRGLLILVAPNERKLRIEVGCGLESTITNQLASDIIEERITPEFREGDYPAGINAGADALIAQLALPRPANDPGPHSDLCKTGVRKAA
jgi:uncharacterized protein